MMPLPDGFTLRRATDAHLDTLVAHRRSMFRDMGYSDIAALDSMSLRFREWLVAHMNAGDYLAWLIDAPDNSTAAGTGLWLMDWPSHMIGHGKRGNILNVYTEATFRRRGLARYLMDVVIDWCRENQIDTVVLHASDEGKGLYESMGFQPTNEMRRRL
jgi:ribosomal protein S18 acetylase RimI-like enzyme